MIKNENPSDLESEEIEIKLLLEAIHLKYGYDFRNYSRTHIKRRVLQRLKKSGFKNISQIQHSMLYDPRFFGMLLQDFSINVTEMFRDPSFYCTIRKEVIPVLKTYPFIKIWHAGCATGEEVYSMAILLKEEGILDRCQIYATDFNEIAIEKAKEGIYPIHCIREYTENYQKSGGLYSFADYYTAKYDAAIIDPSLKEKIIFSHHNLAVDGVFGQMHMIICRNVLIYFNKELQNRVIKLFLDSLYHGCVLGLGSKEHIKFTKYYEEFDTIEEKERIFGKKF